MNIRKNLLGEILGTGCCDRVGEKYLRLKKLCSVFTVQSAYVYKKYFYQEKIQSKFSLVMQTFSSVQQHSNFWKYSRMIGPFFFQDRYAFLIGLC